MSVYKKKKLCWCIQLHPRIRNRKTIMFVYSQYKYHYVGHNKKIVLMSVYSQLWRVFIHKKIVGFPRFYYTCAA